MAGLKSVLVVEDEAMIRDLYRSSLVDAGFSVETAGDSEELYKKLVMFHPDVIFLDIMLPDVSGLQILKEIRSNPELGCTQAKIVILTNLAQHSVAEHAMSVGADGYIIKADILPKDLPKVIASMDEGKEGESAS